MKTHAADWAPEAPTPAQLKELFAQIASGRVTRRMLQTLLITKEEDLNTLRLLVNYDLRVEAAIKAGKYDWVNDNITSQHFPTSRTGQHEVEVKLFHFNQVMTSEQVIAEMEKQGYRPAELHELLALGAKYPELQRQFPVVSLGSVWQFLDGNRCVPYLNRHDVKRNLNLNYFDNRWNEDCRFAAVRK